MRKIVILGSTGSIGTQTLEVIDHLKDWEVVGLSANKNIDLLEAQARKYKPQYLVLMYEDLARELEYRLSDLKISILVGIEALNFLAGEIDVDLVLNALVGAVGIHPSLAALEKGNKLALANKESLVVGGELIKEYIKNEPECILPVDSEHNAIFQVLRGQNPQKIKKLLLTASGGPFRDWPLESLQDATLEQALKHPNWKMGGKITIDSATMMNKGLEVIEAHYLFQQAYDKIEVLIHPESVVHSLVEFIDGSLLAEMGVADMRIPIQYALSYPERERGQSSSLDLSQIGALHFEKPDFNKFPALKLAYYAGKAGGSYPVVLNAANEIAVEAFLERKISFLQISQLVEEVLTRHTSAEQIQLEGILYYDQWARAKAKEVLKDVIDHN